MNIYIYICIHKQSYIENDWVFPYSSLTPSFQWLTKKKKKKKKGAWYMIPQLEQEDNTTYEKDTDFDTHKFFI